MKKTLWILATGFILASCTNEDPGSGKDGSEDFIPIERRDIFLSCAEQDMVNGSSDFAYTLFSKIVSDTSTDENIVLSPYTISGVLSMIANASTEVAADEIAKALGWSGVEDMEAMNSLYPRLTDDLLGIDNQVKVNIANSIWVCPDYKLFGEYEQAMRSSYNAEIFNVDIRTTAGFSAFNEWCSKASGNLIQQPLGEMVGIANMAAAIASVNYFEGAWENPFDKSLTKKSVFYTVDSVPQEVEMMEQKFVKTYKNDSFTGVRLNYGNKAFRMSLLMPNENIPLSEVVAKINAASISALYSEGVGLSTLYLPKFSVEYANESMQQILCQLGMPTALDGGKQTMPYFVESSTGVLMEDMDVKKIVHKVAVIVDEDGAKAAGSTVAIPGATMPKTGELHFDRPFVFIIDEQSTGSILFMGAVKSL